MVPAFWGLRPESCQDLPIPLSFRSPAKHEHPEGTGGNNAAVARLAPTGNARCPVSFGERGTPEMVLRLPANEDMWRDKCFIRQNKSNGTIFDAQADKWSLTHYLHTANYKEDTVGSGTNPQFLFTKCY